MRIKKILFTLMVIILTIAYVEAKEVNAIYEYIDDNSVYSKRITSKDTNVKLDNFDILIKDTQEKYKNNNIKIITVTDENQLTKLKKQIKNGNIEKAYYFIFEDINKNQINVSNLNIKLNNNSNKYIIYTINGENNIIDKSNNDKQEIEISNNNYFAIATDNDIRKINYKSNDGGIIVLDGQIISDSGIYTFKSDKIIIRSNSDYEIKKATLNGKDILDEINNGFLDVSNEYDINLELDFIEIEEYVSSENYHFSGQVIYNGKPLANAYIELHSDVMTTITDEDGNFYFNNVPLGKHSITISHDDNVIGYSEFLISNNENEELELLYKKNERVINDSNNVDLILYINDDYDVTIKNKEEDPVENNGQISKKNNYLIIIFPILIILVAFILIYKKNINK